MFTHFVDALGCLYEIVEFQRKIEVTREKIFSCNTSHHIHYLNYLQKTISIGICIIFMAYKDFYIPP